MSGQTPLIREDMHIHYSTNKSIAHCFMHFIKIFIQFSCTDVQKSVDIIKRMHTIQRHVYPNFISYAKFKPPSQNILPEKYVIPFEQVYDMPIMIKYCDIFETTMNKKLFVLEDWSRLNIYITYSNHVSFISFL